MYNTPMSKRIWVIILGLWIAIVPFFGLPGTWKNWIITASGLLVALIVFIPKTTDQNGQPPQL